MVITNINDYLNLTGYFINHDTDESQVIDYTYIGWTSSSDEFLVDCELNLLQLCQDNNVDINDIANIKILFDGYNINIKKFNLCNSNGEIVESVENNGNQVINLGYLKSSFNFDNICNFSIRSFNDGDYQSIEAISCEIITSRSYNYDNKPLYKTKLFERSLDNLISYKVNLNNGQIDFFRNVVSLYGNKTPLKLSQFFNPINNDCFDNWKFNLEQKLYFLENKYYWIDSNYKYHEFLPLENNLYYDSEHTGLLLRINNNEFVITNDTDKFYHFDQSKNLISIESKKGIDSIFLYINRSSNILSFVDGMGRTAQYSINNSSSNLVLPDSTILSFTKNQTYDIFTDLDGSQNTYYYKICGDIKLLISAVSSFGKTINFYYDEFSRIIKIEEFSGSEINKRVLFEYFNRYTIATVINNPKDLLISSITGYSFDNKGHFIFQKDLINFENSEHFEFSFYNYDGYEQFSSIIRDSEAINITRVQGTNYFGINTDSLNEDEDYLVYAKLKNKDYNFSLNNSLIVNLVDVWPACYFVKKLFKIDYSFDGELILAAKIRPDEYSNGYIILEVDGNAASLVNNKTFYLVKTKRNNSYDLIKSTSQASYDFIERKNDSSQYWKKTYSLKFSRFADCEKISFEDYNLNKWNLSRNNQVILWYNNLSKAFIYNGNEEVLVNEIQNIEVSNVEMCHLDIKGHEKRYSYFENTSGDSFIFNKITNTNWNIEKGLVKENLDYYGNKTSEEDSLGNLTYFDLDNFGNVISTRKVTSLGEFKNVFNYVYSTSEFKEIFIDEDDLIYENTFDLLTGLLKSSKDPKGIYIYFTYDSSYRLINVSSENNSNLITYLKNNIKNLNSSEGNNFTFSYDSSDVVTSVKIDDNNHILNRYVKTPNKESISTLYSNSKGSIDVYNRFGNLVQKGSITTLFSPGYISLNNIYGSLSGNYSNVNAYNFNDETLTSQSLLRRSVHSNLFNSYSINYFYYPNGKLYRIQIPNEFTYSLEYSIYDAITREDFSLAINNSNVNSYSSYTYSNIDSANSSRLVGFEHHINDFILSSIYSYDNASRINTNILNITLPMEYGYSSIKYINTYKSRNENNVTYLSNKLLSRSVEFEQNNFQYNSTWQTTESFTYTTNGFLESISTDGWFNRFKYDNLNRLIREDNQRLNCSYTYTYNSNGNITSKYVYAYTTGDLGTPISVINYGYNLNDHKDQLVSWNGYSFSYDNAGNPLTYKGNTLSWNNSNKLSKFMFNSSKYLNFEYNGSGIRREKVYVNSNSTIRHTYTYHDNKLYLEKISGNQSQYIAYIYEKDEIVGFYLQDELPYLFRKNILGDVIGVFNYLGELVAEYAYDAWGNCIILSQIDGIGDLNPIRYRSYYFDDETGLYYLINRYYDPEIGRFISPDSIEYLDYRTINGVNFYCYCLDNPVFYYDPNGDIFITISFALSMYYLLLAVAIVAILSISIFCISESIRRFLSIDTNNLYNHTDNESDDYNHLTNPTSNYLNLETEFIIINSLENKTNNFVNEYKRKVAAPRIKSKSKKEAKQKAFLKGGKRKPILHSHSPRGPHFHPDDDRFKHRHYYFDWLVFRYMYEKDDE